MTHELKILPEYFEQVRNGRMPFQLRRSDRDYQVGDHLLLKEYRPDPGQDLVEFGYTGRELLVRVDYIMDAEAVRKIIHPLLEPDDWDEHIIMSTSHVN